jgi:hypothetical protein
LVVIEDENIKQIRSSLSSVTVHIFWYLVVKRFICRDIMEYIIDMGPNIRESTFIKGTLKMVS